MRTRMIPTNRKFVIGSAFALVLVCSILWGASWHEPVRSQGLQVPLGDGSVRFVAYGVSGLTPGQMLRITVPKPAESPGRSIAWTLRISDTFGNLLFASERIPVPSGEFRYADVSRRDLPTAGDPQTGRVQVLVKVVMEAPRGSEPEFSPGTLEVINEATGETATSTGWEWRKMVQDGD